MISQTKVLYIINNAPDYRDIFLRELGKHVDLTVVSFSCKERNLNPPLKRENYQYIELKYREIFGFSFNFKEFTLVNKIDPQVVFIGYNVRNIFRLLNLFRK